MSTYILSGEHPHTCGTPKADILFLRFWDFLERLPFGALGLFARARLGIHYIAGISGVTTSTMFTLAPVDTDVIP
jgi:hypothetical protein